MIRLAFRNKEDHTKGGEGNLLPWSAQNYITLNAWCRAMSAEHPELEHWVEDDQGIPMCAADAPTKEMTREIQKHREEKLK